MVFDEVIEGKLVTLPGHVSPDGYKIDWSPLVNSERSGYKSI